MRLIYELKVYSQYVSTLKRLIKYKFCSPGSGSAKKENSESDQKMRIQISITSSVNGKLNNVKISKFENIYKSGLLKLPGVLFDCRY
jgi:hypothetical protein